MNKIAVIKTGGKQYNVKKGDVLKIEKIKDIEDGNEVEFDTLMVSEEDGNDLKMGAPVLDTKVKARIVEQGRGKKVRVVHYKSKTRQHKVYGHRQEFAKVEILSV